MKKVLLVGGISTDDEDSVSMQKLHTYMKEVLGKGAEVRATFLDLLEFSIAPGSFGAYDSNNGLDLRDIDQVFIRGPKLRLVSEYGYYLSRFCAWNKITFLNDYSAYYPGTKVAQSIIFLEEGAPFLKTIFSVNKQVLLARAEREFGYPYILKTSVGSHGDSNHLVRSAEQAQQIIAAEPNVKFLAQEFCLNDRDYRLLLMQGSSLVFERRGGADTHLNNTSKGGVASLAHGILPDEIIEKGKAVAKRLGLTISGVDVMPHLETGKYYFLEVNSQPQLRTGALLEEKKTELRKLFGITES